MIAFTGSGSRKIENLKDSSAEDLRWPAAIKYPCQNHETIFLNFLKNLENEKKKLFLSSWVVEAWFTQN